MRGACPAMKPSVWVHTVKRLVHTDSPLQTSSEPFHLWSGDWQHGAAEYFCTFSIFYHLDNLRLSLTAQSLRILIFIEICFRGLKTALLWFQLILFTGLDPDSQASSSWRDSKAELLPFIKKEKQTLEIEDMQIVPEKKVPWNRTHWFSCFLPEWFFPYLRFPSCSE